MTVVAALKAAGKDLTREKVVEVLKTLKVDTKVMAGPIEFGPTDRAGQESTIYMKFDGKTTTRIPGVYTNLWQYKG
jgi:branched-chain amino acid transport system substrate-binding protein